MKLMARLELEQEHSTFVSLSLFDFFQWLICFAYALDQMSRPDLDMGPGQVSVSHVWHHGSPSLSKQC